MCLYSTIWWLENQSFTENVCQNSGSVWHSTYKKIAPWGDYSSWHQNILIWQMERSQRLCNFLVLFFSYLYILPTHFILYSTGKEKKITILIFHTVLYNKKFTILLPKVVTFFYRRNFTIYLVQNLFVYFGILL